MHPGNAGISNATALESEHGFCVIAVRKPAELPFVPSFGIAYTFPGARTEKQHIRTFADWSSSESSANNAWIQNFSDGRQNDNNNKTNTNRVRAVRVFAQKHFWMALKDVLQQRLLGLSFLENNDTH